MARHREFHVHLSKEERHFLKNMKKNEHAGTISKRIEILLQADENTHKQEKTYAKIAAQAGASEPTVINTLKLFESGGIIGALKIKRSPNSDTARVKATGEVEARIIATACSPVPEGRIRWTLSLLEKYVVLEEPVSRATIGRVLQRNNLRPHLNAYWCIPPKEDAEFVANMEDVLDVYHMPYDPKRPLWCMDEKPYQILGEAREPLPMRPGDIAKIDSEYKRNGTVSVFCFIQPHTGNIEHYVEETRTAVDWAEKIRLLVDVIAPDAEKITLVMDNLNTHSIASLYKAFPPDEARRIARKLEVHYTPKHGSWLDIAEIGINIMTRECLNQRIPSIDALRQKLDDWNTAYNADPTPIQWQFSENDARIKLRSLYPNIDKARSERDERRQAKVDALEKLQA